MIDGPMLELTATRDGIATLESCVARGRRAPGPQVTTELVAVATRVDAGTEPVLLGIERTSNLDASPRSYQTAFLELDDGSELGLVWQVRVYLSCEENELVFRVLEGPPEVVVDVEWMVAARVDEDRRSELRLEIHSR